MIPETINGKKVTKKEAKFLAKLEIDDTFNGPIQNPMSGDSAVLNGLQEAIYSFIMGAQMMPWWDAFPPAQGWSKAQLEVITDFSTGLDMFRKYWASEYMTLLD